MNSIPPLPPLPCLPEANAQRLLMLRWAADYAASTRLAALEEAARAVELIEAQCEAEDVDSPELPVVAAAIRALKGAKP